MENDLYRFIADRYTPIMDNIEKYCVSRNKSRLDIVRIVFDFLPTIKIRLDEAFVDACMSHILSNATEREKRMFAKPYLNIVSINDYNADYNEMMKLNLKRIEGGNGNITELMYYAINSKDAEIEKSEKLLNMVMFAKDKLYMFLLASMYLTEETGIEIKYIDNVGSTVSYTYSRSEFITDYEIINKAYTELLNDGEAMNITKSETPKTLLSIPGANTYINKAVDTGIVAIENGKLIWNKSKVLLAYFAENISGILGLSNKIDKEGDVMVNWKITEVTFNLKNLKGAKNDYMKSKDIFKPKGHEDIDSIFK